MTECQLCEENRQVCEQCRPLFFDCDACGFTYSRKIVVQIGGDPPYVPPRWIVCPGCADESDWGLLTVTR